MPVEPLSITFTINPIIGIDPGKNGGIAIIFTESKRVEVVPMPIAGKNIDVPRFCDWVYERVKGLSPIVCIEKVHAITKKGVKQGVTSMFTFGFNVGVIHGAITSMLIPMYLVPPQTWKKHVLEGTAKDKHAAIDFCNRVYPGISLLATERSKTSHSGMADALCIAHYALEKYNDL